MKFISYRYWLNEKFTDDNSDPIKDMGIGIYVHRDFRNIYEVNEWILKIATSLCNIEDISKLVYPLSSHYFIVENYAEILKLYCQQYITINGLMCYAPFWDELKRLILKKLHE